jgi:hypothetical protein
VTVGHVPLLSILSRSVLLLSPSPHLLQPTRLNRFQFLDGRMHEW